MNTSGVFELVRKEFKQIDTEELKFHSDHEAWAVLLEEVEETKAELVGIEDATEELKKLVFSDDWASHKMEALEDIRNTAILCAAEAIQVAAVANKFIKLILDREEQDD